ncbi:MAG TPA: crosslink repair DNA glycosylase YcaQ family protein, partial [Gemmatimonadales bacterium]|nr:crosslink repair DNA glycosylase YcaQ family protein [Gemmatimonadales bacterium]
MTMLEISGRRRENQLLIRPPARDPAEVVAWFGAVQAQDYRGALWAVGLRTVDAVESDVELAIAERRIVRTWPMRGTLHFVAADDVRWMLDLLAPRIVHRHAGRLEREFELDAAALSRCRRIITTSLRGQSPRTRAQVYQALKEKGMSPEGQRGVHILSRLAQEGLICGGPREGKQPTFVLMDEWLPETRGLL